MQLLCADNGELELHAAHQPEVAAREANLVARELAAAFIVRHHEVGGTLRVRRQHAVLTAHAVFVSE